MPCDVALFGEVKLPELSIDAFLTADTLEALLPGFPIERQPQRSAEAVLEELQSWPLLPPEHLRISFDGGRLEVKGLVSRETFLSIAANLVSLCRTAAPHGAGGTLLMVGLGGLSFGYQARCAFGRSSVRALSGAAIELLRDSPAVLGLRNDARASLEVLLGDGAGAPFTGAT